MEQNKSSKTGLFITLAVILVLIVGGFVFFNTKKSSTVSTETSTSSVAPTKTISLNEVAKHAVKSDCWMAIEGSVYDVTSFVPKHPGEDAILLGCGKDATSMFNSRPSDGTSHSNRARQTLATFQIGVLAQ